MGELWFQKTEDGIQLHIVIYNVDTCVWITHLGFLQLKERNRCFYGPICLTCLRNVFEKEEIYACKCLFLPDIKEAYGGIYIVRQIFFATNLLYKSRIAGNKIFLLEVLFLVSGIGMEENIS